MVELQQLLFPGMHMFERPRQALFTSFGLMLLVLKRMLGKHGEGLHESHAFVQPWIVQEQ